MRRVDLITGIVTAAVGAFASWDASDLAMFGEDGVPGAGFLPRILAGVLIGLGLALAVMSLRGSAAEEVSEPQSTEETPAVRGLQGPLRACSVLVAFGVIAPFVDVLGYMPSMILLVAVVLYGIERRRDFRSLLAVVLIPVVTYLLFADVFEIPLPMGPLMAM